MTLQQPFMIQPLTINRNAILTVCVNVVQYTEIGRVETPFADTHGTEQFCPDQRGVPIRESA